MYGKPLLRKATVRKGETARVTVEVTNAGKLAGDEIVQLYIRDVVSTVTVR
jgi:beta-glucosidase